MATPESTTLRKINLADRIAAVLQARIISGDLAGGGSIRQDVLAAELGVSKIPLREAFAKLEQNGLVTSEANRGYFVRPLSVAEAFDVFDLRLKIEPDAAAHAASGLSGADVAAARQALAAMDGVEADRSPEAGALNRAFHIALVAPSRRPVSVQMIERLHIIGERYVVQHLAPRGRSARAGSEHRAIFDAWAAGDTDGVRTLSQRHIAATLDDLRDELAAER